MRSCVWTSEWGGEGREEGMRDLGCCPVFWGPQWCCIDNIAFLLLLLVAWFISAWNK